MLMHLHFIGNGLYGVKRFIREAKRIGVQRAVPLNQCISLEFGDRVLLAVHKRDDSRGRNWNREGQAIIFGYFVIDSVTYEASEQVREYLHSRIDMHKVGGGFSESRICGSYTVDGVYEVDCTLSDIVRALLGARKKFGEKIKFFLRGKFYEFKNYVSIPKKFTRGLTKIDINPDMFEFVDEELGERRVYFIRDYRRVVRLTKKDLMRLESIPLTEFVGGGVDDS